MMSQVERAPYRRFDLKRMNKQAENSSHWIAAERSMTAYDLSPEGGAG